MSKELCSVTIITFNEEANLREALDSVTWADEIVVVDSGSTDRTLQIAREFTDKIFVNTWPGMREQKNFASSKASHEWVLNLDADERVTPELRTEILGVLGRPVCDAYSFPRKNFFLGKWMKYGGWYPDEVLRLFRKSKGKFGGVNPHCNVVMDEGQTGHLKAPLLHYTYTSLEHYISKQFPYADAAAQEIFANKRLGKVSGLRILFRSVWKFSEVFIWKLGFLDGARGLIVALGASFATYMRQARLWELGEGEAKAKTVRK